MTDPDSRSAMVIDNPAPGEIYAIPPNTELFVSETQPTNGRTKRSRAKPSGGAYATVLAETLRPLSARERALVLSTFDQMPSGGTAERNGGPAAILSVLNGVIGLCETAGNIGAVKTVLQAMSTLIDAAKDLDAKTVALQHEAVAAMLAVYRTAMEEPERRGKK